MDLDTFLSVNIADQFAARNVGPFLLKLGVCRQHLLNQASLKDLAPPDAVVDLMFFLKKEGCLLYTSPSPRDVIGSRMPSSA